jgi:hypothetical protein
MHPDYRNALTAILARLDRMEAEADAILAGPADTSMVSQAEELRELIVEMRAKVEGRLDAQAL